MPLTKDMTIQELAQHANNVQNACNLTGVVLGFGEVVQRLRALYPDKGTDWFNRHPIVILWIDKLTSLAGTQNNIEPVFKAYKDVDALATGGTIDY